MIDGNGSHIDPTLDSALAEAVQILRAGGLVAFPTETVYGLGADACQDRAVAAIFAAKDRPRFNPLIVHFADAKAAGEQVVFDHRAEDLAAAFWPGPLSLVLPRREGCRVSLLCSAGLDSLAVRVPDHPLGHRLLSESGLALAAPSANASGRISPTTASHVAQSLGERTPFVLNGGPTRVGLESTVVDLTGPHIRLLRPGGVSLEAISSVVGPVTEVSSSLEGPEEENRQPVSPGLLSSHYAPVQPMRLEAMEVAGDEALLAFGPTPLPGALATVNLSPTGDLIEAAAGLFAALFELDRLPSRSIAVMPIPQEGLGRAINDRLSRAAAPRPLTNLASKVDG